MDYKSVWNEICFFMEKSRNASERDFQTTVEFLFEKLGWSQYKEEILSQNVIPVGSAQSVKPDIIIRNNGENVFVVELKKPNVELSGRNIDQLISYMRLLRLNFGILIGDNLQIYYELPNNDKPPLKITDIAFLKDLDVGAEFIEIFGKKGFSDERVKKYCEDKIKNIEMMENSQKYVNLLCSTEGIEFVSALLKEKLLKEFSEEIISSIFEKINIRISKKGNEITEQKDLPLFSKNPEKITQNAVIEKSISPQEAKIICKRNGLNLDGKYTFASKNRASNHYWANPYIGNLLNTWWFILNDFPKQEIHVLKIPAHSISKEKITVRKDQPDKMDIQIKYGDKNFEDNRSGIKFGEWFIKTISY